jgi:hypothetical protein
VIVDDRGIDYRQRNTARRSVESGDGRASVEPDVFACDHLRPSE